MARMSQLQAAGLVAVRTVLLHPEIPLDAPLATWFPGHPQPDPGAISWQAEKRWRDLPKRTQIVTATEKGRFTTGAPPGRHALRTRELLHDIHVTRIFLKHYYPHRTDRWTRRGPASPTQLDHAFIPDAVATQDNGRQVAIDFIGSLFSSKAQCDAQSLLQSGHGVSVLVTPSGVFEHWLRPMLVFAWREYGERNQANVG